MCTLNSSTAPQKNRYRYLLLAQCWADVVDGGPTMSLQWTGVSYLPRGQVFSYILCVCFATQHHTLYKIITQAYPDIIYSMLVLFLREMSNIWHQRVKIVLFCGLKGSHFARYWPFQCVRCFKKFQRCFIQPKYSNKIYVFCNYNGNNSNRVTFHMYFSFIGSCELRQQWMKNLKDQCIFRTIHFWDNWCYFI